MPGAMQAAAVDEPGVPGEELKGRRRDAADGGCLASNSADHSRGRRSAGASSAKDGLSLSEIGRILLKWKWLILACLLVAIFLGYVYSKTRVPLYEGTATIDLNPSQTNMGLSDLIQESLSSEDVRIPTEVARMQSNLVVFYTIKELALQHRGPFPDAFDHLPPDAGMDAFPPVQLQVMIGVGAWSTARDARSPGRTSSRSRIATRVRRWPRTCRTRSSRST